MTNNNETVEQAYKRYTALIKKAEADADDVGVPCVFTIDEVENMIDHLFAAHKRELAAKDGERLAVSANYESVIAAKDRINEAKDRVIEAKIAEIARLKQEVENGIGDFAKAISGMVKRDALIKELTDAMCKNCRNHTVDC